MSRVGLSRVCVSRVGYGTFEIDVTLLVSMKRLLPLIHIGIGCGVPWTHMTNIHNAKHKISLS